MIVMTKYVFRLQRVKRVRAVEEEVARARYGAAEIAAREAELLAEEKRQGIERAIDELRGLQGSPSLAPSRVLTALVYVDEQRADWRAALEVAQSLRARSEEERKAWLVRKQDVEALERLDDRARDEHRFEQDKLESLALDETASQRAARTQRVSELAADGR
jgi:flagellar export protein FliJ